jgi:hypothetical protein
MQSSVAKQCNAACFSPQYRAMLVTPSCWFESYTAVSTAWFAPIIVTPHFVADALLLWTLDCSLFHHQPQACGRAGRPPPTTRAPSRCGSVAQDVLLVEHKHHQPEQWPRHATHWCLEPISSRHLPATLQCRVCTSLGCCQVRVVVGATRSSSRLFHAACSKCVQVNLLGGPSLATMRVSPRMSWATRSWSSRYTVSNLAAAGQWRGAMSAQLVLEGTCCLCVHRSTALGNQHSRMVQMVLLAGRCVTGLCRDPWCTQQQDKGSKIQHWPLLPPCCA